jgi:hypothetical protein
MTSNEAKATATDSLVNLLRAALSDQPRRKELISRFQNEIWSADEDFLVSTEGEIFSDLAHDLDYYEPDPVRQSESSSYFGDERLESLVRQALADLQPGSG